MTRKYIPPKASDDEEEEEAKKKRRLKVAHGGKAARLGRKRKREDGGNVTTMSKTNLSYPKPVHTGDPVDEEDNKLDKFARQKDHPANGLTNIQNFERQVEQNRSQRAHGGKIAKRKHRDDGGNVGLPPQPEPEAPKPSWYRIPDTEESKAAMPPPVAPSTKDEFAARWGADAKPWTPETNNPDRKRGGKVKR